MQNTYQKDPPRAHKCVYLSIIVWKSSSSSSTFGSDDVVNSNSMSLGLGQETLPSVVKCERRSSNLQASLDADESSSTEIHVVIVCAEDSGGIVKIGSIISSADRSERSIS